jgi:hypothetical protein
MSSDKKDIYNVFFDIDTPVAKFKGFFFNFLICLVNDDDLLQLSLKGIEHQSKGKITLYSLRQIASWGYEYCIFK